MGDGVREREGDRLRETDDDDDDDDDDDLDGNVTPNLRDKFLLNSRHSASRLLSNELFLLGATILTRLVRGGGGGAIRGTLFIVGPTLGLILNIILLEAGPALPLPLLLDQLELDDDELFLLGATILAPLVRGGGGGGAILGTPYTVGPSTRSFISNIIFLEAGPALPLDQLELDDDNPLYVAAEIESELERGDSGTLNNADVFGKLP